MRRTTNPLAAGEILPSFAVLASTAAPGLVLRLGAGGRGQKLLPTVVAAKVERLSIAFDVEGGCLVHGHSADRVFGLGFRFIHGHVPFFGCIGNLVHNTCWCLVDPRSTGRL